MAKLYFRYGSMNSGKSTLLLQVAHNYNEKGMQVLIMKPMIDSKGNDMVVSRLGIQEQADNLIKHDDNIYNYMLETQSALKGDEKIACILIDESQFLSKKQVEQLLKVTIVFDIPVICYGLRTDFLGQGFEGSTRLLELAHSLEEIKTICSCGKKATMNLRYVNGRVARKGEQVGIDNQDSIQYKAVCPSCWSKEFLENENE